MMPMPLRDRLRLMVITDRRIAGGRTLELVAGALDGGATAVMMREKSLEGAEAMELARELRRICTTAGALFIVNRFIDIAKAVAADGVHLGHDSPTLAEVRAAVPAGMLVGVSLHRIEEIAVAQRDGADYAVFSPVFRPLSKESPETVAGLDGLRGFCRMSKLPVVALGGIVPENAASCLRSGACGVAAIGAFAAQPDSAAIARGFIERMAGA